MTLTVTYVPSIGCRKSKRSYRYDENWNTVAGEGWISAKPYLAYGNEPEVKTLYMAAALVVEISPKQGATLRV